MGYHQTMNADSSHPAAGFYDSHIHAAPDVVPRIGDDIDIARGALAAGLAGIVLKNHIFPTGARAALTARAVPGIEVAGGIVLNGPLGFTNAEAVEASFAMGGTILWMATRDARSFEAAWEDGRIDAGELEACLACIARHGGVLGTGHLNGEVLRSVVEAALKAGVERIVINHPDSSSVGVSLEEQIEYAGLEGVRLERAWLHLLTAVKEPVAAETMIAAIRATGLENNIIATDLGRPNAPMPWEGMAGWCRILAESGFSREEIESLGRDNPREVYFSRPQRPIPSSS